MTATNHATSRDIRTRTADDMYRLLALVSAAIWTLGTLLYFIVFAAPAVRPVFPAMQGMIGSVVLAGIPWLFRRQITEYVIARRLSRLTPARPASRTES